MITSDEVRDRLVRIAKQLLRRTSLGEISWDETDREEDFVYPGTDSSVSIYRNSQVNESRGQYKLTVFSQRGAMVGELRSGTVTRADPNLEGMQVVEHAPWNEVLRELHTAARTSALNVEGILDSLMDDLEASPDSDPSDDAE